MTDLNIQKVFEMTKILNVKLGTKFLFELRYLKNIITYNNNIIYIYEKAGVTRYCVIKGQDVFSLGLSVAK